MACRKCDPTRPRLSGHTRQGYARLGGQELKEYQVQAVFKVTGEHWSIPLSIYLLFLSTETFAQAF